MTVEEVITFLKTEEGKAGIAMIADEFGLHTMESVSALERKKNELLGEKKKLQSAMQAYGEHTPESIQELTDQIEALKKRKGTDGASGEEIDALKKQLAREKDGYAKKLADVEKERSSLHAQIDEIMLDNSINQVLTDSNVASKHRAMLSAALRARAKVERDAENVRLVTMLDDSGLSLPIKEFGKKYFSSETGKEYVAAPVNSGTGARGSSGNGASKSLPRAEFEAMSPGAKMKAIQDGIVIT